MNLKHIVMTSIIGSALAAGTAFAQAPVDNINPHTHPNLSAAQRFIDQAYLKLTLAQQANHDDMQGHAQKAKDLLADASRELKAAAEAANEHRGGGHPGAGGPGEPVDNVSDARHPNLSDAQRLIDRAFNRIAAAQTANEFDMQGHAEKARDLLDHAAAEVKAAAEAANRR